MIVSNRCINVDQKSQHASLTYTHGLLSLCWDRGCGNTSFGLLLKSPTALAFGALRRPLKFARCAEWAFAGYAGDAV